MKSGTELGNALRTARILQGAFLSAVCIYIVILITIQRYGIEITDPGDPILGLLLPVLTFVAILSIVFGLWLPRRMVKGYKQKPELSLPQFLLSVQILRCSFLESVAIYGLMLGIMGAAWNIVLPFFFVAAAALIVTFPTEERWKKLVE